MYLYLQPSIRIYIDKEVLSQLLNVSIRIFQRSILLRRILNLGLISFFLSLSSTFFFKRQPFRLLLASIASARKPPSSRKLVPSTPPAFGHILSWMSRNINERDRYLIACFQVVVGYDGDFGCARAEGRSGRGPT
jgi:hypothetical protein